MDDTDKRDAENEKLAALAGKPEDPKADEVAGLPVAGYKPTQNARAVAQVDRNKHAEERVLRILDALRESPDVDARWLQMGRTHIEQGFMFVNRAVFQPSRINNLPEDAPPLTVPGDDSGSIKGDWVIPSNGYVLLPVEVAAYLNVLGVTPEDARDAMVRQGAKGYSLTARTGNELDSLDNLDQWQDAARCTHVGWPQPG